MRDSGGGERVLLLQLHTPQGDNYRGGRRSQPWEARASASNAIPDFLSLRNRLRDQRDATMSALNEALRIRSKEHIHCAVAGGKDGV